MMLVVTALAPAALFWAPSVARGLFDLRLPGAYFVAVLGFLASCAALVTGRLVLLYGDRRLDAACLKAADSPRPWEFILWGVSGLSIVSGICAIAPLTAGEKALACGAGFATTAAIFFLAVLLQHRLNPQDAPVPRFLPGNRMFARALHAEPPSLVVALEAGIVRCLGSRSRDVWIGYLDDSKPEKEFLPGHLFAATLLALTVVLYSLGRFLQVPWRSAWKVPALAYALVFVILVGWLLTAVGFLLDRYRTPTLVILLGLSYLVSFFSHSDHFYTIHEARNQFAALPPAAIVKDWRQRYAGQGGLGLIVVAAEGGGIQAAGWTARVLTGLAEQIPNTFSRSVRFISSASGGSVGAMYFVNAYRSADGLPAQPEQIVDSAMASSLSEIAWGVAYLDLPRPVFPPFSREKDRGWAMERAWRNEIAKQGTPEDIALSAWRAGVEEGWRPATVFNATVGETGEPFFLASFDMPHVCLAKDFNVIYKDHDISLVTAARLSSTFPYVTPMTRAQNGAAVERQGYHIADGGYYDNFGVVTMVHLLEAAALRAGNTILLIQIRGRPPGTSRGPKNNAGWAYETVGPATAVIHVRDTAQYATAAQEVTLLTEALAGQRITLSTAVFDFPDSRSPLSWHLSDDEKEAIRKAWEEEVKKPPASNQISIVRAFLDRQPPL